MTLSRRAFLQSSGAAVGVALGAPLAAQDRFDQAALLDFWPLGKITLMHVGPLMGEVMPHYQRPPEVRIGVGDAAGKVPYLTGEAFRVRYGIGGRTPMDYAHTHEHFVEHARAYGKMGGLDRVATVLEAIRKERPGALFLTGVEDWRFAVGDQMRSSFLLEEQPSLQRDTSSLSGLTQLLEGRKKGPAPYDSFERGGARIEVVHHVVGNDDMKNAVAALREDGADLIICLSMKEFESCRALAETVPDLDIVFSSGFSDALPEPEKIGKVRVFSSGTQGRFVTRIDVDVKDEGVIELDYKLIPIFSDLVSPDPQVAAVIHSERAVALDTFQRAVGQADELLFRRGALNSSWDEVICAALMEKFGAQIALTPGLRWGRDIIPGQKIMREDLMTLAGGLGFSCSQKDLTGRALKDLLEEHSEQVFSKDPAKQGNRDMLRVGGLGFELDVNAELGARIGKLTLLDTNTPLEMDQIYSIAGWGFDLKGSAGPLLSDLLENYITKRGRVGTERVTAVSLKSTN